MNNKFTLVLSFSLLLGIMHQSKAQDQSIPSFSLQQSIEYALEHQADIKNATLDEQIAQAQIKQTIASGLPQLNADVNITNNFKLPVVVLGDTSFVSGKPYTATGSVRLSQLIFDGSFFVGLKAAKVFKELATKNQIKTTIDVKEAVSKAYYTVLISQEQTKLAIKELQRLDSLHRETKLMYENGFAENLDVNRVKVQLNNAQTNFQQASNSLEVSEYLLKFQIGMPIYEPMALSDKIEDIDFSETLALSNSYTYDDRIEISQFKTMAELKDMEIRVTKALYMPTLNLVANYGVLGQSNDFSDISTFQNPNKSVWFSNGAVGLQLNIPIFDGFLKKHQVTQAKIEREQIYNQASNFRNAIDLQVSQSKSNLLVSVQTVSAQRENRELATSVFEQSKIKYQEGVGSSFELIEAQADLQAAETNYYMALYNAIINKVELEKAVGVL